MADTQMNSDNKRTGDKLFMSKKTNNGKKTALKTILFNFLFMAVI